MSRLRLLPLALAVLPACYDDPDYELTYYEQGYLAEDVTDLMTNVLATGENAFFGDAPSIADVTQVADATNQFTAVYLLPDAFRPGLGQGSGDVALQVTEDGVLNPDPLSFSFDTTTALTVVLVYDIVYLGMTDGARETDIALRATLTATRSTTTGPWVIDYVVGGTTFFGTTFCDFNTRFQAPGPPSSGVVRDVGDGGGYIDDPDVVDVFDVDIDYADGGFKASGPVGCCLGYDVFLTYDQLFF